jgi:RNA-directed DNA polymerase
VTRFCRRHGYGVLNTKKSYVREQFLVTHDVQTVLAYNSEFRGFANYYSFADDVKSALGLLEHVVFGSIVKTLAVRHRTTSASIMARLRKGSDYEVKDVVRGKPRSIKLWRLKHLNRTFWVSSYIDAVTGGAWWVKTPNDLIDRLSARECEACGDTIGPFEMHHLRRLRDLRSGSLTIWKRAGRQRKTVVLCPSCRADVRSCREQAHAESRVH